MDGSGEIQIIPINSKCIKYKLEIRLINTNKNYRILVNIIKAIGGSIKIVNEKKEITWQVSDKKAILDILNVFYIYPPLTSRLVTQLDLLKISLNKQSINRHHKYIKPEPNIIKQFNINHVIPFYFSG